MTNAILNIEASALRALQNAVAPSSDPRYYLHHIRFDLANAHAVSADGHIMVEYPLDATNYRKGADFTALTAEYPEGFSIMLDKKVTASWGTVRLDFSTGRAQGDRAGQSCGFRVIPEADAGFSLDWRRVSAHQSHGSTFAPRTTPLDGPLCFNPSILQKVTEKSLVLIEIPDPSCGTSAYRVVVVKESYLVTLMPARPPQS